MTLVATIRSVIGKAKEIYVAAVDSPMPISRRKRQMFAGCYFLVGAVLAYLAWNNAADKTFRIEAAGHKQQAVRAVDSSTDFGQVILDADGKIISWNHGMTTLTGRSSKQMVGKYFSDLAASVPDGKEKIDRLLAGEAGVNYANLELPRLGGPANSTTLVRMQVRQVSGQPGSFRFVAVDPVTQINAVTP